MDDDKGDPYAKVIFRLEQETPMQSCRFYKRGHCKKGFNVKGPKNSFDSYRGVFRVNVFRNILD